MPPAIAIAGAAVVGAGATIISGNKAAKASQQGAETAADASERATEAQVGEARRQYDTTRSDYAPYRAAGYGALDKLQQLYGLPSTAQPSPAGGVDWGAYVRGNPDAMAQWSNQTPDLASFGGDINKFGEFHYQNDGARRDLTPYQAQPSVSSAPTTDPTAIISATPGYQFRKQQATDSTKAQFASRGLLGSTAAVKNIAERVDGVASSEYDSYANRLAALAGVGQSATGSTAAAGSAASSTIAGAYGANGVNQGNAATAAGNARSSAYSNTGSAINNGAQNLASLYLYQNNGGFGASNGGFTATGSPGIY